MEVGLARRAGLIRQVLSMKITPLHTPWPYSDPCDRPTRKLQTLRSLLQSPGTEIQVTHQPKLSTTV